MLQLVVSLHCSYCTRESRVTHYQHRVASTLQLWALTHSKVYHQCGILTSIICHEDTDTRCSCEVGTLHGLGAEAIISSRCAKSLEACMFRFVRDRKTLVQPGTVHRCISEMCRSSQCCLSWLASAK